MNVSGYLQGSESSVALNFNSVFASDFKKVKYTQKVWHELSSKYIQKMWHGTIFKYTDMVY
jgi:hypothetical protein